MWFDSKAAFGDFDRAGKGQSLVAQTAGTFSQLSFERYLQSMWSAMLDVCVCVD